MAGADDLVTAPAEFRRLLAQSDHALGPVQQRIGIAPLRLDVDPLVTPHPCIDNGDGGPRRGGESALWFIGPLHRCSNRVTFFQTELVAHPDFISITQDRS